jgi:hypothetical protein
MTVPKCYILGGVIFKDIDFAPNNVTILGSKAVWSSSQVRLTKYCYKLIEKLQERGFRWGHPTEYEIENLVLISESKDKEIEQGLINNSYFLAAL